MQATRMALVLGATGNIGGAVARALRQRGWTIRTLHRRGAEAAWPDSAITWVRGDAMIAADVIAAAKGASLIVHAVNPPGYRRWGERVLPMLDNTIAAAKASGATVLLPGNVYNYGPSAFPLIAEDAPQAPVTRKGAIRVAMEQRLRAAAMARDARVIVVRAGDYFGGGAGKTWFSDGLLGGSTAPRALTQPGDPGVGHAWAYVPDLAETMAELVGRASGFAAFETFHFSGHWDPDGTAMTGAIRRALGRPDLPVRRFPWTLTRALSPVVTMFREMQEMRYLWRVPVRLDNTKLVRVLGAEPHTPLDTAVRAALGGDAPREKPAGVGLRERAGT